MPKHIPTVKGAHIVRIVLGDLFDLLNWDEHLQRLRQVLTRLQEARLKLHSGKCQFFRKSVSLLISQHGVETDPVKIQAITHWPPPTNTTELRNFLGLSIVLPTFYSQVCRRSSTAISSPGVRIPFQLDRTLPDSV